MNYPKLREELKQFYWYTVDDRSMEFCEKCIKLLDSKEEENMTIPQQKVLQYRTITEEFDPVLFYNSPFYYETGTMSAHCDGARDFRRGYKHAGGWVFWKNQHVFVDQDPELFKLRQKQGDALLYLICGAYNDTDQHFSFYYPPIFAHGLKGVYEKAEERLKTAETEKEKDFLHSVMEGLLCLKKMSEKFSEKAADMIKTAPDDAARKNLERIKDAAKNVPWNAPETFYEALNTYAFLRKTMGALEGVGFNTFGRVDVDLYPFYKNDLEKGILTEDEAYELICKFLITFDLHYDHDMKMVGYSDHEMENTYVLGGYGQDGDPVYNEITKMFLKATRTENIIFPKIKCRFSENSPKEYLDEINKSIINGTSTVLYQNDDAVIPALLRNGKTLEEARDYIAAGCWDVLCYGAEKNDCGAYTNLLKAFEYSVHKLYDEMDNVQLHFAPIDDAKTFEEVYDITLKNLEILIRERNRITRAGGQIWDQVDVLPLFSSTLAGCIEEAKDYTSGGGKYRNDVFYFFGLPNIVDSLLAIKELCFDKKQYTLKQMLDAVRNNWKDNEDMRIAATKCSGWGDGNEASCTLANRLNNDLYNVANSLTGTYGGRVNIAHLTYTEIRFWGEQTKATPDGRYDGDYFAQGLTPSRLKKIPSVTDVVYSLTQIDKSTIAGNSVANIILPAGKTTLDICEIFLRCVADSAIQSLQLNCTSKEQLLDAQKHPEKYPDLIVRVTGFSVKFTSLTPEWQQEVISRNFYE